MSATKKANLAFGRWFNQLKIHKASAGPAKGTIAGALVVLERLKDDFDLDLESHTAKGGSQIKGASGRKVAGILAQHNEVRSFTSEGGRTNRGLRGDIGKLLSEIRKHNVHKLSSKDRRNFLTAFQNHLVDQVRSFHNRQRLRFVFDPTKTTWQTIHEVLLVAKATGKDGPVAQHLVGAKLQLRYPSRKIENHSFSTADEQLGRSGDYTIGDTTFHVTVSPSVGVFDRCKKNISEGVAPYLIVPDSRVVGAKQNAEDAVSGKITIQAIESFVSQNLDELSEFSNKQKMIRVRNLLDVYNERINEVETDKSLMIDIPKNLKKI